jgi:hypothetical protein
MSHRTTLTFSAVDRYREVERPVDRGFADAVMSETNKNSRDCKGVSLEVGGIDIGLAIGGAVASHS